MRERVLHDGEMELLRRALGTAGLPDGFAGRTWVVFIEAERGAGDSMARCFLEEAGALLEHGARVMGLSAHPIAAPEGAVALPFPLGLVDVEVIDRLRGVDDGGGGISFVLFPDLDPVRLSGPETASAHLRRVLDLLTTRRLDAYQRALDVGRTDDDAEPRALQLGASLGVPRGRSSIRRLGRGVVVETGPPQVIAARSTLMAEANRTLARRGRPPLFPSVVATETGEDPGWLLMEGVGPPLASGLLEDLSGARLSSLGLRSVGDAITGLSGLHEVTRSGERLDADRPWPHLIDLQAGLRHSFGPDIDPARLLDARVLPGEGPPWRSLRDHFDWLNRPEAGLDPPDQATLHGDAVLERAFFSHRSVVFIQPRATASMEPIRGDPVEDLASFITSVRPLATVNRSIDLGDADSLVAVREARIGQGPDLLVSEVHPEIPPLEGPDPLTELVRMRVPQLMPSWGVRFHRASALSLLRVLGGPGAIRPPAAWLAVFLWALAHLERARRADGDRRGNVRGD